MAFTVNANRPVRAFRQGIIQDIESFNIPDRNRCDAATVGALEHKRFFQCILVALVDRQELPLILKRFSISSNFEIRNQAGHGFAADDGIHEKLLLGTINVLEAVCLCACAPPSSSLDWHSVIVIPPKMVLRASLPAATDGSLPACHPVRCLFQGSGPDRTSAALSLRPPASPFGRAFIVKVIANDNEYSSERE